MDRVIYLCLPSMLAGSTHLSYSALVETDMMVGFCVGISFVSNTDYLKKVRIKKDFTSRKVFFICTKNVCI